jgi:hypothetical protein
MTIRAFQPGDEIAQVSIYNEAAAELPRFKPATVDEIRRRTHASDFDPESRSFATEEGKPVGYVSFQANGRISYPWCRKGYEGYAESLFDHALEQMRERGMKNVFAAYRGDWEPIRKFFLAHRFTQAREMLNFVMDFSEMPTPGGRYDHALTPLRPEDVPEVLAMAPWLRVSAEQLEQHLLHNPYFPPHSVLCLRQKSDGPLLAVSILIEDPTYAHPGQVDASMPCYRLGAFGSEGMSTKRIYGLFSFLAPEQSNVSLLGLNLLGRAVLRLEESDLDCLAAQVPSDVGYLVRFYKHYFRLQGSFPIYERTL